MKIRVKTPKVFRRLKVALSKFILSRRIDMAEINYAAEKLNARQAESNAQFYKIRAGILKYQLEDLQNAAE